MSGRGLRVVGKADKSARIRAAAMALFKERGFDATTTREVAERADIGTGTLFLYVRTKDELLDFVFAGEISSIVDASFTSLPKRGDIVARLMHLFDALLDYYARDVEMARLLVRHALMASSNGATTKLTAHFLGRCAELIREALAAGQLAGSWTPDELAIHAFSLYLAGVLGVVNGITNREAAGTLVRRALEAHFAGVRPSAPASAARAHKKPPRRSPS